MRQSTVLLVILNKICVFLSTMQIRILELSLTQRSLEKTLVIFYDRFGFKLNDYQLFSKDCR